MIGGVIGLGVSFLFFYFMSRIPPETDEQRIRNRVDAALQAAERRKLFKPLVNEKKP